MIPEPCRRCGYDLRPGSVVKFCRDCRAFDPDIAARRQMADRQYYERNRERVIERMRQRRLVIAS